MLTKGCLGQSGFLEILGSEAKMTGVSRHWGPKFEPSERNHKILGCH